MANYSEAEIRAFKKKDLLNSRMSALKAAATNYEGKGIPAGELEHMADSHFKWLQQDQDKPDEFDKGRELAKEHENKPKSDILPEPTLAQKKILDAIAFGVTGNVDATDMDAVKSDVLDWAESEHGVRKYPNNESSVKTFLAWLN